jgi:CO/xanthine dehydrogenase FAD-binding subunit
VLAEAEQKADVDAFLRREGCVKPAKFEYHAPTSVDEALPFLQRYDGEARVLAGGQSLVPMMNFRLATPAAIIDLNRIAELASFPAGSYGRR